MAAVPAWSPRTPPAWRRVAPGLVALALAAFVLAAGPWTLDRLRGFESAWAGHAGDGLVCSYRARTGQPCVGCGGTTAFRLAARGDWRQGFQVNVLGASAGASVWLVLLASAWSVLRGRPRALLAPVLTGAGALLLVLLVQVALFFWGASAGAAGRAAAP